MQSDPPSLAPWRSPLARALHRNRALPQARYLQLATVGLDGRPRNRTVVFRGFVAGSDRLKFICDRRSQKVEEIDRHPWAEACWYFPKTREQFRLSGSLRCVGDSFTDGSVEGSVDEATASDAALRQNLWESISANARETFYGPTPGQIRTGDAEGFFSGPVSPEPVSPEPALPERDEPKQKVLDAPTTFSLILFTPTSIDHLELRGSPQNRCQYNLIQECNWIVNQLNP